MPLHLIIPQALPAGSTVELSLPSGALDNAEVWSGRASDGSPNR